MDTHTHTPVRPTRAERARTVLAAAASASVLWDGGRVDLLGGHHDDRQGDVILTLGTSSTLVKAVLEGPSEENVETAAVAIDAHTHRAAETATGTAGTYVDRASTEISLHLTELCAVNAHERVRARVVLTGTLTPTAPQPPITGPIDLRLRVTSVVVEEHGTHHHVGVSDYREAQPDPLHTGSAAQLQHIVAHHPEAIEALSRLCTLQSLIGATRVLPIALDRYGIVLRVERLNGYRDVRLAFSQRVDTGIEAAVELRQLMMLGERRRPCGR